ncbi:MAG: rhomboid family intramembrane serine protease [Pseudomonadota bacterium]
MTFTLFIVAVTCGVSLLFMDNGGVKSQLLFHPVTIRERKQWYRFLSSGLIHADFLHLAINMFVLWSFGTALESFYYPAALQPFALHKFMFLYVGGIAVASIPAYLRYRNNPHYAALGASGGVSAVVFAVIVFDPWQNLYLYGVLPIPQILGGAAYLYYSWYMDKRGTDNIGHMAHFTGALWGFVFTIVMNPALFGHFFRMTFAGPNW